MKSFQVITQNPLRSESQAMYLVIGYIRSQFLISENQMESTPHLICKIIASYYNNKHISMNENILPQMAVDSTIYPQITEPELDYSPISQSLSNGSNISPLPSTPSDQNNDISFFPISRSPTPPTPQISNNNNNNINSNNTWNPSRVLITTGSISRSSSISYHSDSDNIWQDILGNNNLYGPKSSNEDSMELYDYINEPWPDIHHVIDYNKYLDDRQDIEQKSDKFVMIILIKLGLSKYNQSFREYGINKETLLCLDMSLIPMLINNMDDANIFCKWMNRYKHWKGMKRIMFNMDDLRYLDHELTIHVFGFLRDFESKVNQYIPDVIGLLVLQYYLYLYMNVNDIDEYCMCWTDFK